MAWVTGWCRVRSLAGQSTRGVLDHPVNVPFCFEPVDHGVGAPHAPEFLGDGGHNHAGHVKLTAWVEVWMDNELHEAPASRLSDPEGDACIIGRRASMFIEHSAPVSGVAGDGSGRAFKGGACGSGTTHHLPVGADGIG